MEKSDEAMLPQPTEKGEKSKNSKVNLGKFFLHFAG